MRDLESRERKALEDVLRKAELSFAAVWCYPGCRIPIWANTDLQGIGVAAPETQHIMALLWEKGRGGTPKATGLGCPRVCCPCQHAALNWRGLGWQWCCHGGQPIWPQPHGGWVQGPPRQDSHVKGSRLGRLPDPWKSRCLHVSPVSGVDHFGPAAALPRDGWASDPPLLQGWFKGDHWGVCCCHCLWGSAPTFA